MKNLPSPQRRANIGALIAITCAAPGIVIMLSGIRTFIDQMKGWLKTGDWTPHTVFEPMHQYLGMQYRKLGWWAAQKIADFFLSFPAALCLFVVGYFLMCGLALAVVYPLRWIGLTPAEGSKL